MLSPKSAKKKNKTKPQATSRKGPRPSQTTSAKSDTHAFVSSARKLGGSIGSIAGQRDLGENVADFASRLFTKITGKGDYSVSSNSLWSSGPGGTTHVSPSIATFSSEVEGIRVCHKELVRTVYSSQNFATSEIFLNPGLTETFPWLAQIAVNFEFYKFNGLVFQYRPTSGVYNAATPALGTVLLATQYDVVEPSFESKQEMMSSCYSTSSVPSAETWHPIECRPMTMTTVVHKTRHGSYNYLPVGAARQLYDHGKTTLAAEGNPSSGFAMGELWLTYDVSLFKPKMIPGGMISVDEFMDKTWSLVAYTFVSMSPYNSLQPLDVEPYNASGVNRLCIKGSGIYDIHLSGNIDAGTWTVNVAVPHSPYVVFENLYAAMSGAGVRLTVGTAFSYDLCVKVLYDDNSDTTSNNNYIVFDITPAGHSQYANNLCVTRIGPASGVAARMQRALPTTTSEAPETPIEYDQCVTTWKVPAAPKQTGKR